MSKLLGADGCADRWVYVLLETATGALTAGLLSSTELASCDFDLGGIDIPIGLSDRGPREADQLARQFLRRPRCSSVFPAPIRPALNAQSRLEACTLTEAADGRRVQAQAFGILPKIRAIDCLLRADPCLAAKLYEIHPEVSFATWAGRPMAHNKKSMAGKRERQELIGAYFGPGTFSCLREMLSSQRVPADDLADALAVLWSVARLHGKKAKRFPAEPAYDSCGLPMHIWY
jgi:predicted RNase H-like nuclease